MQVKAAVALLLTIAASPAVAVVLGGKPAVKSTNSNSTSDHELDVTAADVAKLHKRLETVALGLDVMLMPGKHGSLTGSKIAPALRTFLKELRSTLSATAAPKDISAAMTKLRDAQAGVADLTKSLTSQQEVLMHQDATEQANLLLGVLMTRRNESIQKQLDVLKGSDFSSLPVSRALLAKHDSKTPLFQQVALYMDSHSEPPNMTTAHEKAHKLTSMVVYFEERVNKLDDEEQVMQRVHKRRLHELDELIKASNKKEAHRFQLMKKGSEREYRKRNLVHKQQTKMMKDIVSALKQGNVTALKKAQDALRAHVEAMQKQNGNFLHLLQLGHRLARRDCPFCVAQCIGKCHDAGSPYEQCMPQCADAGQ